MPSGRILVISEVQSDQKFGAAIADRLGFPAQTENAPDKIRRLIEDHSETIVLFNGQNNSVSFGVVSAILQKTIPTNQVFLVTDRSLGKYPHLLRTPFFGHHLLRRYGEPAIEICTRLVSECFSIQATGLKPYFPEGTPIRSVSIEKSSHKRAVIEAIQKTLTARGLHGRISTLVTQSTDELILNAIFNAARTSDGKRKHHSRSRSDDFVLSPREKVQVEFAITAEYVGICVSDFFGTLHPEDALQSLRDHFQMTSKNGRTEPSMRGFGIHGIVQAGMNLVLIAQSGTRTDAILLLPVATNVVGFKRGFKFFSVLSS
jgi:hypothetical protein